MKFEHLIRMTLLVVVGLSITRYVHALPVPPSLKTVAIPKVPGLVNGPHPIIRNALAAKQLGKALFWDMSVGSDGVACATCHFHAGADRRHQNQLESGSKHQGAVSSQTFERLPSGQPGGPNYTLKKEDFPLFQLEDPVDKTSKVTFSTDDVISSSGVFLGDYQSNQPVSNGQDTCSAKPDLLFHVGMSNTRRVSVRNAPTIFNAAYNYRNFWDGRANNLFNGANPYGPRDEEAGVWILRGRKPEFSHLLLENSSLASQAVAPALDDREMACQNRRFIDLAEKLLPLKPLLTQEVSKDDSLLGTLRDPSGRGLRGDYRGLIQKAFHPRFWASKTALRGGVKPAPANRQIEANFAFFFGLAIQSYESTLISDETRFDGPRKKEGEPIALSAQERKGLRIFSSECMLCHQGPTFSAAAHPEVYSTKGARNRLVDRREINGDFDGSGLAVAFIDIGFSNTSVTPTNFDVGLGGTDPYGYPLSFSEQFYDALKDQNKRMIDPVRISVCDFQRPFEMDFSATELKDRRDPVCGQNQAVGRIPLPGVIEVESLKLERGRLLTAVQGAFKIPGLRNVELTGPYMHNGSMKNLEEVLAFYDRGGNLSNPHHVGNLVFPRPFPKKDREDLIAFLKSLTDERVRWERAPFDHPELRVSIGLERGSHDDMKDHMIQIPALGKKGRSFSDGPLKAFEDYLP